MQEQSGVAEVRAVELAHGVASLREGKCRAYLRVAEVERDDLPVPRRQEQCVRVPGRRLLQRLAGFWRGALATSHGGGGGACGIGGGGDGLGRGNGQPGGICEGISKGVPSFAL